MISRNSRTIRFVADYIALPILFLVIIEYCSLIYLSRSHIGSVQTLFLLTLGVIALGMLSRGIVRRKFLGLMEEKKS